MSGRRSCWPTRNIAFEVVRTERGGDGPPAGDPQRAGHRGDQTRSSGPSPRSARSPGSPKTPVPSSHAVCSGVGPSTTRGRTRRPSPEAVEPVSHVGPTRSTGVTIVEFGYFYAMPFGLTMAASFGAPVVIKVKPLTGDPMRANYGIAEAGAVKVLEGKESIALDLKTPEGHEIIAAAYSPEADVLRVRFPSSGRFRATAWTTRGCARSTRASSTCTPAGMAPTGPTAIVPSTPGRPRPHPAPFTDRRVTGSTRTWRSERAWDELRRLAARLQPPVDGDSNAALAVLSALSLALFHQTSYRPRPAGCHEHASGQRVHLRR